MVETNNHEMNNNSEVNDGKVIERLLWYRIIYK